jgi:GWxTD domain-containing protein
MRTLVLASILLLGSIAAFAQAVSKDWINSPEAYFATPKEREEWFRLETDAQRKAFVDRYWALRGDQFRQVIEQRIVRADQEYTISGGDIGSRTARGLVFIVLGPPAGGTVVAQTNAAPPPPGYAPTGAGGTNGIGDTLYGWRYDSNRNPNLMKMLGRGELTIQILVEPGRRRDTLQDPGLFEQLHQLLAEKSIVYPDLYKPITTAAPSAPVIETPRIPAAVETMMQSAPAATSRNAAGIAFTTTDFWTAKGPSAVVSIAVPNAADKIGHLTTYGEVRAGDRVVATVAEPFAAAKDVIASNGTAATVLRLDLPPGTYQGSFALVDDRTSMPLLNVSTPLHVSDPAAAFAMSSLILGDEPKRDTGGTFIAGNVSLQPRGDLTFRSNESAWYFATVHSATPLSSAKADIQLRRDGKLLAGNSFDVNLIPLANGGYLFGQELPLSTFKPGDYTLSLTLHGPAEASETRKADFRIVAP